MKIAPLLLLVEDDSDDVLFFERAFREVVPAGRVRAVKDGNEAVDYLAGGGTYAGRKDCPSPDLIVLDLKLPLKSGFEVLQWLRSQPGLKRIPVIVLTSSAEKSDVNQAYELGANSYLTKPLEYEGLLRLLRLIREFWLCVNVGPDVPARRSGPA